jgi:ferredoxin
MIINNELCNGCKRCIAECYKGAIGINEAGNYVIDAALCNNCKDLFDIECIRVCAPRAITREDGSALDFNPTRRLRFEHLAWLIAIMGERGGGNFPLGNQEWDAFRKIISAAFLNPELKVRLSKNFDDVCIGCHRKQEAGHPEKCGNDDDVCSERLGVPPGTVMKLWDVIKLVEDKYSIPFLKQWYKDDFIGWFRTFVSPDAKILTNTE